MPLDAAIIFLTFICIRSQPPTDTRPVMQRVAPSNRQRRSYYPPASLSFSTLLNSFLRWTIAVPFGERFFFHAASFYAASPA